MSAMTEQGMSPNIGFEIFVWGNVLLWYLVFSFGLLVWSVVVMFNRAVFFGCVFCFSGICDVDVGRVVLGVWWDSMVVCFVFMRSWFVGCACDDVCFWMVVWLTVVVNVIVYIVEQ